MVRNFEIHGGSLRNEAIRTLGGGNLRALLVISVFAITAHATLKGVLAPLRTSFVLMLCGAYIM